MLQPHGRGEHLAPISSEAERNRLALGVLIKPPSGVAVRTEADGIAEDQLIDDLESLLAGAIRWRPRRRRPRCCSIGTRISSIDPAGSHRPDLARVVVTSSPSLASPVSRRRSGQPGEAHSEPSELLEYFKVNAAIRDALKPRVDLLQGADHRAHGGSHRH